MQCAVDSGYLVANECIAIMSAMRKSSRQTHSGIAAILGTQNEDGDTTLSERLGLRTSNKANVSTTSQPLIWAFAKLRSEIESKNFSDLTAVALVDPFIAVIKAPSTTGAITSLALSALEKMVVLKVINTKMPDIGEALYKVAMAITNCRFRATDQYEDDAVLVQLMGVLDKIIVSELGLRLCNEAVCELVETCLSMACQMRRGDALRRSVVSTVTGLMRLVFSQLPFEDQGSRDFGDDVLNIESPMPQNDMSSGNTAGTFAATDSTTAETDSVNGDAASIAASTTDGNPSQQANGTDKKEIDTAPFSTPAILETFRVLVSITNPQSQHAYTDSTRVMVLRILRVCFEIAGRGIAQHSAFVTLISAHLFKYLAQLVRREHPALVYESLQLVGLIMETGGQHYKLQLEFILVYLLGALAPLTDLPRDTSMDDIFYDGIVVRPACVKPPGPNATSRAPEIREIMVETLTRFSHGVSFFPSLFANYDCDTSQTDMCQDLVGFLCRSAYPDSATWSTPAVPPLCLEAVLALLQRITSRSSLITEQEPQEVTEAIERKRRKDIEIVVTTEFNKSPKKGIELMLERGVISEQSPQAIAAFLRSSRRLHKGELGRFLAKAVNKDILRSFIDGFDFTEKRIDEALREFLCCFRLPGESAEIEPIFERFSEHYIANGCHSDQVANADAAFVLAYAVIMLNTDQHSPQVKRRMEFDSFKNNLRGANNGKDFNEEYLREIYTTIKHREIVLPEEHDTDETFEYAWRELQLSLPQASEFETNASPYIDRYVFANSWRPIVSTLSFIFATATDDVVFSRVITGFRQAASLAAKFELQPAFDHIVRCLAKISTLASGDLVVPKTNLCVAIYRDDGTTYDVIVSDLSSPFGSDLKAQMASITMFKIFSDAVENKQLSALSPQGWELFARVVTNLYIYDLFVPPGLDRVPAAYRFERGKAGRNVGIFSALSSYLTANPDEPSEPSDEEVDAALGAQDCVTACNVLTIVDNIIKICAESSDIAETAIDGIMAALPPAGSKYSASRIMLLELSLKMAGGRSEHAEKIASVCANAEGNFDGLVPLHAALVSGKLDLVDQMLANLETADGLLSMPNLPVGSARLWQLLETSDLTLAAAFAKEHSAEVTPEARPAAEHALAVLASKGSEDALDALYGMQNLNRSPEEVASYLTALQEPCYMALTKELREGAVARLQKILLEQQTAQSGESWQRIFDVAVIGLLNQLLKPEVFNRDATGMERTRQQASSLGGKVFLHYAMRSDVDIEKPWLALLRVLDRLLSSRRQPALQESVTEMLKNVVLVMRMAGHGTEEFWNDSERQLKGFVPEVAALVRKNLEPEPEPEREPELSTEKTPETPESKVEDTTAIEAKEEPSEQAETQKNEE